MSSAPAQNHHAAPLKAIVRKCSSPDAIASSGASSCAVSSVDSGSFGPSRHQTSPTVTDSPYESLSGSTRTTSQHPHGPVQRSQRLLIRVPSTGAVFIVPASALLFGRHKQRGKPLMLCAGFDGAEDASTAVCPDPENCRHVHADMRLATPFHPHRRSAAMLGQYPRMPAGTMEPVLSTDGASVELIPAERMLLTRALEGSRRPMAQCAHFLASACNRGSECEFAHVVGASAPVLPAPVVQQQKLAPPVSASKNSAHKRSDRRQHETASWSSPAHQQQQASMPPQMEIHTPHPRRFDCSSMPQRAHTMPRSHAMPCCPAAMPMPSAATVLSSHAPSQPVGTASSGAFFYNYY